MPIRRLIVALLFIANILNYMDRQIIAVLKPLLQDELGWSDADYGTLTSIFQFAAAIGLLCAGRIVDRIGWRWSSALGVGSWSLAAMAHGFARTLGEFSLARVVLGFAEAFATPNGVKTVASLFSAGERSLVLGILNVASNMGAIITPLILPAFALAFGWSQSFVVVGGIGVIWAIVWLIVAVKRIPAPEKTDESRPRVAWSTVLTDRRTWAVAGAKVLTDQVWWFLLFWMPDLLHRRFHLDMQSYGFPLAVIYTMSAVGGLSGGYISGRLIAAGTEPRRARKLTMLGCSLIVTSVLLVLVVDDPWSAVLLLGLTLAAHQGVSVNIFALSTDIFPSASIASAISVAAFCGNIAGMVILQAAGWWIGSGGGYAPFIGLAAISYLLAVGWLQLMIPGDGVNSSISVIR